MQVNCRACGGSLKLTDQWRETGILRCPFCDAENLLPEEVLAPQDQPPEKQKDSNIQHIRGDNRLEFHIGPSGTTEVSKLMLTGLVLGCVFSAGAFLGGLYVNRLLWIAAGTFAWLTYVSLKQVVHAYHNHRRIAIDADTFLYEQYDLLPGFGLRLWHIKREFATSRLRSIQLHTLPIKTGHEPDKALVLDYGKRPEVLGFSPATNSVQELQWLDYEIHDFLTQLDRKQARLGLPPIPAAHRDTVSISRGLDFYCFSCGSPVELTVETIMKRAAPCNYCGGEVILHHRLRPDLLQINEKFLHAGEKTGSPVRVHLAKDSMKIEVPALGFTEGSLSNLVFDLMLSISMALLAYVLAMQGYVSKYKNWLWMGGALSVIISVLFFKNFLHVLKAVFGSVTITIDSETCTISRRLFKWVRHVSYSSGDISQARVDTGSPSDPDYQGDLGFYRDLSIEFEGTWGKKIEKLVYADFGDQWQWIADEINAFKTSLDINAAANQASPVPDL